MRQPSALLAVVLASALHRLHLYEDAFGLTRARLLAEGVILWLGALIVLVVGATCARRRSRASSSALARHPCW